MIQNDLCPEYPLRNFASRNASRLQDCLLNSAHVHPVSVAVRYGEINCAVVADEPFLRLFDKLDASGRVQKQFEAPLNVVYADLLRAAFRTDQLGRGDQVAGITETRLLADLGEKR